MSTEDWFDIMHLYKDTAHTVQECIEDGSNTTCSFRLGYYEDWEARGMSGPWAKKLGWACAAGDYGQRGRSASW